MVNIIQDNKANIILNTYALARASWIEDDFVSSFVPMAASVINQQGYETIKVDVFTSDFEDEYGIQLPSQPAIKLLSILQKKGFITFDEGLRLWKPNIENISKIDLTKKKTILQSEIENVYKEFISYAKEKFNETLSVDNAKTFLYSFIQANSAKILNGELKDYKTTFKTRNIIGSFVVYTKENNAEIFDLIK